jgi:hypothetical protein
MLTDIFEIGSIRRMPLGTSYVNVVAAVHALLSRCPQGTDLVVDATGVGKPVVDMFQFHGVLPWSVTATAGIEQTIDWGKRTAHVPKLMLISRIQSLLFEQRLKVHAEIPAAPAFLEELQDFRVEFSASGNMTYNARSGRHDDMISAAAVAAWRLSDGAGGAWHSPSPYLAAVAMGLGDRYPRPTPWVIGLDLGKVNDPTALVVMRKVAVERPDVAARPLPKEPEGEVPPEIRTDWRIRYDEMTVRSTPDHPEAHGGPVEWINGPQCRTHLAPGSVEYAEQNRND